MIARKTPIDRLRPEIAAVLEYFPPVTYDPEGIAAQRAGCEYLKQHPELLPTDPAVHIFNTRIPVSDGSSINLRVYEPVEKSGLYPCFIWLHGGGMAIGITESDDGQNIRFVKEAGCIVCSPEYRLAPEHPYPIPLNDCYDALCYIASHADEFSIDPKRIGIGGSSGGGNLALATALRVRDEFGPALKFIMPLTPMINRNPDSISAMKVYHPKTLNREGIIQLWGYYANGQTSDIYMEPLLDDMHGLPAMYTAAGDLDPFCDDTIVMFQKFLQQDIPAELHIYSNCCHVTESLAPAAPISVAIVSDYVRAIKTYLIETAAD